MTITSSRRGTRTARCRNHSDKEAQIGRIQRESFRRAHRAGAKIAYGTDAGVYPHGGNAKQFAKMVEWGMTPFQAIQTATLNAADLLGRADQIGVLESGHRADMIAVREDPLEHRRPRARRFRHEGRTRVQGCRSTQRAIGPLIGHPLECSASELQPLRSDLMIFLSTRAP